jgi:hypothetical protein
MTLEDTGRREPEFGKAIVKYTFSDPKGEVIFSGEDLYASPMHHPESIEMAKSLLDFLTCGVGDVDEDYFEHYTPRQIEFRDSFDRELLTIYTLDD